jgi:4-hydroxybenzoate polyprenyltransferase
VNRDDAGVLFALVKTLRPKQWIKNLLVGVPLVFSQRLFDADSFQRAAAAAALFCLISSCVYVVNDLVDVEGDRAHPRKRSRPIASGALPVSVARGVLAVGVPAALVGAVALEPAFGLVLGGYLALQLAYCFYSKKLPYVDVASIAAGFVLRVVGGAVAIGVPPSVWLLACTALVAMFFGFGKRAHELGFSGERAAEQRASLAHYRAGPLRVILYALAVITTGVYAAYTRSEHVSEIFGERDLLYTLPFAVIGIARFIRLVTTRHDADSPTEEMLRDPVFMLALVAFVAVALGVLYSPMGS